MKRPPQKSALTGKGRRKGKFSDKATKKQYVRGEVLLPNGLRVPYERTFHPGDYRVTIYGPRSPYDPGAALLIEHKRKGVVSWGHQVDGVQNHLSGDVKRYGLGPLAEQPEIASLMMSVVTVRELSNTQAWQVQVPGTTGGEHPTHAGRIYGLVLDALRKGDAGLLSPLASCIKACEHAATPSASQRINDAVLAAANTQMRPPIPYEVAVNYYGDEKRIPASWERGSFYKVMRKAGWGWLILPREGRKSAP
jgi:hypothetical protein